MMCDNVMNLMLYCTFYHILTRQDVCKVGAIFVMKRYGLLGINKTGILIMPESAKKYRLEEQKRQEMQKGPSGH